MEKGGGVLGRDRTFRRHAGMTDGVAAGEFLKLKAVDERPRRAFFFVDFDRCTRTGDAEFRVLHTQPALQSVSRGGCRQHRMIDPGAARRVVSERLLQPGCEASPIIVRIVAHHRELGRALADRVAVHRNAGAVRSALTHLLQHGRNELAQLALQFGILNEQTNNATHAKPLSGRTKESFDDQIVTTILTGHLRCQAVAEIRRHASR